jgi:threonyl-tRNA synthetase
LPARIAGLQRRSSSRTDIQVRAWLIARLTLNEDAALINYAQPIVNELRTKMVRVSADFSATPIKAKIAEAEKARLHTMLVIGTRAMVAGAVSVRLHHGGPQGAKPKAEVVSDILAAIRERRV